MYTRGGTMGLGRGWAVVWGWGLAVVWGWGWAVVWNGARTVVGSWCRMVVLWLLICLGGVGVCLGKGSGKYWKMGVLCL